MKISTFLLPFIQVILGEKNSQEKEITFNPLKFYSPVGLYETVDESKGREDDKDIIKYFYHTHTCTRGNERKYQNRVNGIDASLQMICKYLFYQKLNVPLVFSPSNLKYNSRYCLALC